MNIGALVSSSRNSSSAVRLRSAFTRVFSSAGDGVRPKRVRNLQEVPLPPKSTSAVPHKLVRITAKKSKFLPIAIGAQVVLALVFGAALLSQSSYWTEVTTASTTVPQELFHPTESGNKSATDAALAASPPELAAPKPLKAEQLQNTAGVELAVSNIVTLFGGTVGTFLALTMLLSGFALAIAQASPLPAISGILMSGFVKFMPYALSLVLAQ